MRPSNPARTENRRRLKGSRALSIVLILIPGCGFESNLCSNPPGGADSTLGVQSASDLEALINETCLYALSIVESDMEVVELPNLEVVTDILIVQSNSRLRRLFEGQTIRTGIVAISAGTLEARVDDLPGGDINLTNAFAIADAL